MAKTVEKGPLVNEVTIRLIDNKHSKYIGYVTMTEATLKLISDAHTRRVLSGSSTPVKIKGFCRDFDGPDTLCTYTPDEQFDAYADIIDIGFGNFKYYIAEDGSYRQWQPSGGSLVKQSEVGFLYDTVATPEYIPFISVDTYFVVELANNSDMP